MASKNLINRANRQTWQRENGGVTSGQSHSTGSLPTKQEREKLTNNYNAQLASSRIKEIPDYLSGDTHDSTTTSKYLDDVETALGGDLSEAEFTYLDNLRTNLKLQAKTDAKYERQQNNPLIKAWNYVVTPREKSDVEKLENQRDLAHYAYMGTLDPKFKTEEQEANARVLALKGEISEPDRHRGQIETIPKVVEAKPKNVFAASTRTFAQTPEERENYAKKIAGMSNDELIKEYNYTKDYDLMYSGYATDPVSEKNFEPVKNQLEDVSAEVAKRGLNPNVKPEKTIDPKKAELDRLQAVYDEAARAWMGTLDPTYKTQMEETNARIKALRGEVAESGRSRGQAGTEEDAERQALLDAYNSLVEEDNAYSGYATDPMTADQMQTTRDQRNALKAEIKEANKESGRGVYEGMAGEDQLYDAAAGWAKGRMSGTLSALGTGLEWIDQASDDMVRAEYDEEHGEGAWDRLVAENPELENYLDLGAAGEHLSAEGQKLAEQGEENWADAIRDLSPEEQQAANVAKTVADVAADAVANFILPGSGRALMAARVAGQGAQTQAGREANDVDSRMAKMVLDGGSAFLSEYLIGGAEGAYGRSVLGRYLAGKYANITNPVLRAGIKKLTNTEGFEELLELALTTAGDRLLELDPNASTTPDEARDTFITGYIVGTIFNGNFGGIDYNAEKAMNVGNEAIDAWQSGMSPEEITQTAKDTTRDTIVIKGMDDAERANAQTEAETGVDTEEQANTEQQNAPSLRERMENDQVADDEYLAMLETEDGRAALAEALGVPNDEKSVAEGLYIYILGKQQLASEQNTGSSANETAEESNNTSGEENTNSGGLTETGETGWTYGNQNAGQNTNEQTGNGTQGGRPNWEQESRSRPTNNTEATNRGQRLSQFFSNTLTESNRTKGLDPIMYDPKPETESLMNAITRVNNDVTGTIEQLMGQTAWDGEMVDAAWYIENELYKLSLQTNDDTALNAWRKIQDAKIRETARGLQAVAKQSRPGAMGVLNAIMGEIENVRAENAAAKKAGKKPAVSEEVLTKAEAKAKEVARQMGLLELDIDLKIQNGMSEADAKNSVKEAYLDLIDEINDFRNVGLIADSLVDKRTQKKADKLKTKFHQMLANQDMDYIQRYAACAAAGISEDVHYDEKAFLKRLNTFQKLAQLTGTGTWLRNITGNASFGLIDVLSADNPATVLTDFLVSKKTGKRSSGFEAGILSKAARTEAKKMLERSILEVAGNIDLATDQDQTKYDMARTRSYDPDGKAMERLASRWEQWNGYMLQSSDAWFKGMAEGSIRDSLIKANGWDANNLTPQQKAEIDATAKQVAEYRTFQNSGLAAKAANWARDSANKGGAALAGAFGFGDGKWEKGEFGLGTALMPYATVPANLGVKALEFSPAGAIKGLKEIRDVIKNPNATMAQQNQAVTDFGRGLTGSALIALMSMLMKKAPFFKDWENEDDKDIKAQNKAEGKSGMQINKDLFWRIVSGDKDATWRNDDDTVDISSIEPLNQLLATASMIAEQEDLTALGVIDAFYSSARDSLSDIPSLQTIANIENTWRYADDSAGAWNKAGQALASGAGNVVGGFIPAPLRHATVAADEYARDTSGNNAWERSLNQVKSNLPGLRETLPVKTDNFGNEISQGDLATRIKNQYAPFKYSQVNQSDVSREFERIRNETGVDLMPDRNGPSSVKIGGENTKLTNSERKEWKDDYGHQLERNAEMAMRTDAYRNADDDMQAELIKDTIAPYTRAAVKDAFAGSHDLENEDEYADVRKLDNPITWLTTKAAFDKSIKDENFDAADALLGPINNMSQKDKNLLMKKDSTLKSFVDFLTPNSFGYAATGTEAIADYKANAKANAEERGVTSASGIDKLATIKRGLQEGTMSVEDANAFFTKQQSDGDFDLAKGRATIWLAANPKTRAEALRAIEAIENADKDESGSLDQWGYRKKAQYEVSNAIKENGYDMDVFDWVYNSK